MANNKNLIPIPGRLHSVATEGHVSGADEIYDDTQQKDQETINSELIQAVGTGGSVDSRIAAAVNVEKTRAKGAESTLTTNLGNEVTRATSAENALDGRVDTLEDAVGTGGSVDSRISAAVATETTRAQDAESTLQTNITAEVTRAQVAESNLQELYEGLTQSNIEVVDTLPATGEAYKIYRLLGTNSYADYMYNSSDLTTPIKMAQYDNAIDDEPTAGSDNLVKSGGITDIYGSYIDNPEFIEAKTDREGKLLEARKIDGTKVEYCDLHIKGEIYNEGIQYQKEKLNEVQSIVEDLDGDALKSFYNCENSEYVQVTLDAEERILDGITKYGIRKAAEAPDTKTDEEIEEYECNQDIRLYPAYKDYVNGKIVEINQKILSGSARTFNFFFVTDTHINDGVNISAADNPRMVSAEVLSKLMGESLCRKLVFGGDFIGYNNIDINQDIINHQKYVDVAYKHGGEFIPVRGNHETIFLSPEWNTYPQSYTRNVIFNPIKTDSGFIFNEDDDTSCYYYKDFKHKKLRVFVLDSTDATEEDMQIGVIHVFGARQLQWVCDRINETPSGYDIVFFSHVPVISTCTTTEWIWRNVGVHVRELLKHINNKDVGSFEVTRANVWAQAGWEGKEELFHENHPYELGVVNYDFTNLNSRVIAFVSGHEHGDYQGYDDGILHITTTSDKVDTADYRLWYAYKKLPKEYSKDEFAIDFVSIDCEDDIVSLSRIGRGYGRIFNIGKNTVVVGSSITLTSSLLGPLSWYSYNHDSVFVRREDGYMGYENTRVNVNNGVVAGIQSGESVVFCQDSSGQMEFFDVLVEN